MSFSVAYRAPNIVDILMPKVALNTAYRLLASIEFDGSPAFVQIVEATHARGFLDPAVDRRKLSSMPGADRHVRVVFDPQTFTTGAAIDAGLLDDRQFWLQFQPVTGGGPGTIGPPTLVLTPSQHRGQGQVVISGTAPSGADVSDSLTLVLGRRMKNFLITNTDDTASLFVAFNSLGPEFAILPETSRRFSGAMESTLVVRGGGAAVDFTAAFTVATPS